MSPKSPSESTSPAVPQEPLKSYRMILEQEIKQAVDELKRPTHGLVMSGLTAGFSVGFSVLAIAAVESLAPPAAVDPLLSLVRANLYAVGFIIVILGRMDLFTEYTTIAILPVLSGHSRLRALARLWVWVFVSNISGATLSALLISRHAASSGQESVQALIRLGGGLTGASAGSMLLSAFLAGWLMGLLGWLIAAARDTTSQVLFIWIIGMTIGLGHLHHAITGSVEVLAGYFTGGPITPGDFGHFLLWTTAGNALGGIAFAVAIRYSLKIRESGRARADVTAPRRERFGRQDE